MQQMFNLRVELYETDIDCLSLVGLFLPYIGGVFVFHSNNAIRQHCIRELNDLHM